MVEALLHISSLSHAHTFLLIDAMVCKVCKMGFAESTFVLCSSVHSIVIACCREELTWEQLQPLLLPASSTTQAKPASKPKRKLQPAATHVPRLQLKAAAQQAPGTDAVPSAAPVQSEDASRKPAKPAPAGGRSATAGSRNQQVPAEEEEQAVLAGEPIRAATPAGPQADAGNCPEAPAGCTPCSASKKPRVVIALGSMHTHEQQAYSSKLARIGVACVSHTQCPR